MAMDESQDSSTNDEEIELMMAILQERTQQLSCKDEGKEYLDPCENLSASKLKPKKPAQFEAKLPIQLQATGLESVGTELSNGPNEPRNRMKQLTTDPTRTLDLSSEETTAQVERMETSQELTTTQPGMDDSSVDEEEHKLLLSILQERLLASMSSLAKHPAGNEPNHACNP